MARPSLPPQAARQVRIQSANADDVEAICAQLRAFNRQAVPGMAFVPVHLVAHDDAGNRIGGLVGDIYLGWLSIDVLWVADTHRRAGIGSRLLHDAEALALAQGARGVCLDTFDWQAGDFYLRHGFEVFGQLDDFPTGHARRFLRKPLTVAATAPAASRAA